MFFQSEEATALARRVSTEARVKHAVEPWVLPKEIGRVYRDGKLGGFSGRGRPGGSLYEWERLGIGGSRLYVLPEGKTPREWQRVLVCKANRWGGYRGRRFESSVAADGVWITRVA